jgi:hypothetical protein
MWQALLSSLILQQMMATNSNSNSGTINLITCT